MDPLIFTGLKFPNTIAPWGTIQVTLHDKEESTLTDDSHPQG